ncbi:MAG: filamentous hemagglutinin N-terminal domain-containing protein [Synechococcales bacterium]|nr:filamentous hemagglutinin N-terminal domain-containing protein [Synechococcales bacterium]
MKRLIIPLSLLGSVALGLLMNAGTGRSQIIPDATLPVNSRVSPGCTVCVITGGTERGVNLYHSFQEFSVPTGGSAWFDNGVQIQNILTRVTGTSLSNIDGLIRANGTANLFLLNPHGIVFGPNAGLEIGGSFLATTANSFEFAEGSEFSAVNPQAPPLLIVNITPGVQTGARPAGSTLTNAGNLAVPTGQTITLLGGTTTSTGILTAPGGTVQVLGDRVALLDNAGIDVSSPTGGGTVFIGGDYKGQGTLPKAMQTYVAPTARINADAIGAGQGGKVAVWSDGTTRFYGHISARGGTQTGNGGDVEVSGAKNLTFAGFVDTTAPFGLTGALLLDPTNITIVDGNTLNPPNAADGIWSATEDPGNQILGGDTIAALLKSNALTLQATDTIAIAPNTQLLLQSPNSLTLQARTITLTDATLIQSGGGNIILDTTQNRGTPAQTTQGTSVVVISSTLGTQNGGISINGTAPTLAQAGDLQITTGTLSVTNPTESGFTRSELRSSTAGNGNAGNIKLTVTDEARFDGLSSGVFSEVTTGAVGNGGNIEVTAGTLTLTNRAELSASTLFGSQGNAGNVTVTTGALNVTNRAQLSSDTGGQGNAGKVKLTVEGAAQFDGTFSGVSSSVNTDAVGNGGNVELTAGSLTLTNGAALEVDTRSSGKAGDLKVTVQGAARFDGQGSGLSSQTSGDGKGGNIELAAGSLVLTNQAQVASGTTGKGNGGIVRIQVSGSVVVENSSIDASSLDLNTVFTPEQISFLNSLLNLFGSLGSGFQDLGQGFTGLDSPPSLPSFDLGLNSGGGVGGSIFLQAERLELRQEGFIVAATSSAQGGEINLTIRDLLIMRGNSKISASAGIAQQAGSDGGGNITINAPKGFLVTGPNENNDITANSFSSRGGQVTINAQGIFGFIPRSRDNLVQLLGAEAVFQVEPSSRLRTSDITAISQGNPNLNGTVALNTLNVDPSRGLQDLTLTPVDPSKLVAHGCNSGRKVVAGQSKFVVLGRGGFSTSPDDPFGGMTVLNDLGSPTTRSSSVPQPSSPPQASLPTPIVEAQSWVQRADGKIYLVNPAVSAAIAGAPSPSLPCH